jgi:ABC-2 type transport system ATP-binding protein
MAAVIQTQRLTKRYGPTTALDALDLEVDKGEVFGYLGPNGAGKSTTISLLLGLIRPTSGHARLFGLDAWADAPAVHRRLAYVPSEANLWPTLTGAEALQFLANLHESIDTGYRDELVDRFDLEVDKKIRAYSHGNRQKVLLVAAFATQADLLLLDEPTTGLDPLMEQVFRACVHEAADRGQTVLLSSHILSEVEAVCDRVAMLRAGRIIESGRLDVLRGIAALRVRAELDGPPADLTAIEGVSNIDVDTTAERTIVECDVSGSMEPLLRALTTAGVRHMTTREPSLEELFVSHYGPDADTTTADSPPVGGGGDKPPGGRPGGVGEDGAEAEAGTGEAGGA